MGRVTDKIRSIIRIKHLKGRIKIQENRNDIIRCGNWKYGGFDVAKSVLDKAQEDHNLIVYSFGIGEDLSFSTDIMKEWNCDVCAFDPTPKSISYVRKNPLSRSERFHFFDWGLSSEDGTGEFHLPVNEDYVSGSLINHSKVKEESIKVVMKKLRTIMDELEHSYIDVLKMDIEGSEFSVLESIDIEDMMFGQLCIEIHDRYFKNGEDKLMKLIKRLNSGGYRIISISPNFEEYTFLKCNPG